MIKQNLIFSVVAAFVMTFILHQNDVFPSHYKTEPLVTEWKNKPPPRKPKTNDEDKRMICNKISDCKKLAEVAYHEARSESDDGIYHIFGVIANRVEAQGFPDTLHGVVTSPNQFTYFWDGSVNRGYAEKEQLDRALVLAYNFLHGEVENPTTALFYHTHAVPLSNARRESMVAEIGNHMFFEKW